MAGVEFEQDEFSLSTKRKLQMQSSAQSSDQTGIAGWLMRHGIAKSAKTAQMIQLGIIAVNLAITFLVLSAIF